MSILKNLLADIETAAPTAPRDTLPHMQVVPLAEPYKYKPYQLDAIDHVFRDPHTPYAYVGLDMGLGKSAVAAGIAASVERAALGKTLVVCPPSIRTNLAREFDKFTPWLTVGILQGKGAPEGYELPDTDVWIMGDSSLSAQGRPSSKQAGPVTPWSDFLLGKFTALVVDEAHRFKNDSKRTDALLQLATATRKVKNKATGRTEKIKLVDIDPPKLRVLMSGTIAPNGRTREVATQVEALGDQAWKDIGGRGTFWNYYAPKVDSYGTRSSEHYDELHDAMASSWFFRRLRSEVEDLPNKGRSGLHLEGRGRSVREYVRAEDDLIAYLKDKQDGNIGPGQERAAALIQLTTLRRLAGSCKVEAVAEHVAEYLNEHDSGGVFLVAEHKEVIDGLLERLHKFNPTTVRGGQSDREKFANIDAFTSGESRVLVGQVTAAGVGLTLHGGGINHRVVVAQLPWTPADLQQAEDRLHRLGQTHDVEVEVALCSIEGRWTIDERLWGLLETKAFASSTLMDGEGKFLLEEAQDSLLDTYR